ncbi:unnamed protein product [marine sediment metagenome]|uniref:Uncharacterized protein n=1 Tax=marine sediment metagenome TaxID=412755 RepID=X1TDS7_9ZZZZ
MKSPTPEQIKQLLEEHKVSQKLGAKLSLVGIATFKRYCAGTTKMHPYVWKEFKLRIKVY